MESRHSADRSFQRVAFLQYPGAQGSGYVIRVKYDACVEVGSYSAKLRDFALQVGQCFKLVLAIAVMMLAIIGMRGNWPPGFL